MPKKFFLIPDRESDGVTTPNRYQGYRQKTDLTAMPAAVLVAGSQNVLTNDADRVAIRKGFSLDGEANATIAPVRSSFDWITNRGTERHLRLWDDELEYRFVASDDIVTWRRLKDGFSTTSIINFDTFWDTTELIDVLLFVDGTSNVYEWSGGITTFASATAATITKEGTTSWAEEGFYTTGTRSVVIDGITYTYTGGESTTTLTGVTPDPTLGGHTAGDVIHQSVRTTANTSITGLPSTLKNQLIAVLNNQVYYGALNNRTTYTSKQNNYKDVTFSSPRLPGEGATVTLDATPTAFVVQEEQMFMSSGKDFWFQIAFQLSSDNTKEAVLVQRLKTGAGDAAQSQAMTSKTKNEIIYISNEPTLDTLGRVENIDTSQSKPISDPIKGDFDAYDFTNAHVVYHKNQIFVALPVESKVIIFNIEKGYWEAPQILAIRRLAVIDGEIYGHSSAVPETYKLFDGTSDNGNPIHGIAAFSYQPYGRRDAKKIFDEFLTEGYVSTNTVLSVVLKYDFGGFTSIVEKLIEGDDEDIIFSTIADGSLGKNPIGSQPIGSVTDSLTGLPKFRVVHEVAKQAQDFYELQVQFESNEVNDQWEILAFGPNIQLSTNDNIPIKK